MSHFDFYVFFSPIIEIKKKNQERPEIIGKCIIRGDVINLALIKKIKQQE